MQDETWTYFWLEMLNTALKFSQGQEQQGAGKGVRGTREGGGYYRSFCKMKSGEWQNK